MGEANLGIVKILRPFAGFEALYQGRPAQTPLMFSEEGKALDEAVVKKLPGYDPHLLRGLPVPYGASIAIWFPQVYANTGGVPIIPYVWTIRWRLRSTYDVNQLRAPYHIGEAFKGATDTSVVPNAPRVLIPAATQQVVYTETEPTPGFGASVQNSYDDHMTFYPFSALANYPLCPDGHDGYFQQGVFNPAIVGGTSRMPLYAPVFLKAQGDEMLLQVNRSALDVANWTFGTTDLEMSQLFGTGALGGPYEGNGVYVSTGVIGS